MAESPEKRSPSGSHKKSTRKTTRKQSAAGTSLARQTVMTRAKALRRLKQLLISADTLAPEAIEILTLFQIHVDELTEAGICFEVVRAITTKYPLLLLD